MAVKNDADGEIKPLTATTVLTSLEVLSNLFNASHCEAGRTWYGLHGVEQKDRWKQKRFLVVVGERAVETKQAMPVETKVDGQNAFYGRKNNPSLTGVRA